MFLDADEAKMALRTQKVSGTHEKRVPDATMTSAVRDALMDKSITTSLLSDFKAFQSQSFLKSTSSIHLQLWYFKEANAVVLQEPMLSTTSSHFVCVS